MVPFAEFALGPSFAQWPRLTRNDPVGFSLEFIQINLKNKYNTYHFFFHSLLVTQTKTSVINSTFIYDIQLKNRNAIRNERRNMYMICHYDIISSFVAQKVRQPAQLAPSVVTKPRASITVHLAVMDARDSLGGVSGRTISIPVDFREVVPQTKIRGTSAATVDSENASEQE